MVTAQKRSEAIQDVPASIAAISGEEMADRGIDDVNALQFAVPSFQAGTYLRGTGISIRGVGAGPGSPGVAVSVDGVYQTQTAMADLAQFDLERVETLRGPQGTLYGRNANAGAVNFLTQAPTSQWEGYVLAGYATYRQSHLQGVVNTPLGDRVRSRLAIDYKDQRDGFVKNAFPGGHDLSRGETVNGRLRVAVDLTPRATLDLAVAALHSKGPWEYYVRRAPLSSAAIARNPYYAGVTYPLAPWRTNENDPVSGVRDYASASATLSWDAGIAQVKSITAYQRYTYEGRGGDGLPISASVFQVKQVDSTFTQEVNLSGDAARVDWSAGVFVLDEANAQHLRFNFPLGSNPLPPPGGFVSFAQPDYDTRSYATFADAAVHLTDRLDLLAGARFSRDEVEVAYGGSIGAVVGGRDVVIAATCAPRVQKLDFNSFTPRAGLRYEIDDDRSLYATYAEGFKAGGVNVTGCQNPYKPEKIASYEVGWRSRLLDRTLTLNASAFYYDYTDFQLGQVVNTSFLITNASTAEVKGIEIEAVWSPDEHLTLSANVSRIDAQYRRFTNLDSLEPGLGVQDLSGKYLNRTPRLSANLGVAYRSATRDWGRLTARLDASFRSRTYFREFNAAADSQAPYSLLNVSLVWDSPDERFSARLFATNATAESYYAGMSGDSATSSRLVAWGDPRQVGFEVKAYFH